MSLLTWTSEFLEYLGGAKDRPPPGFPVLPPLAWGLWWGVLALAVYVFCGQSSKFIYIDF